MSTKDVCGIYVIEQIGTGRCYIGSSRVIYGRWYQHRRALERGRHQSPFLQSAWTKHGPAAFSFSVLEECPREVLLEREQEYLTAFNPVFNTCTLARSRAGVPHSAEVKARMRAAMLARPPFTDEHLANIRATSRSPETRARKAAALTGRTVSPETREKISAAHIGMKQSPEAIEKQRAAMTGRPPNPTAIEAMRAANLGTHHSPETREKIRASKIGKRRAPFSPEAIEKMRAAQLGKRRSPEARKRIRAVVLAYWAKRRADAG